jgi:hypothetical protein
MRRPVSVRMPSSSTFGARVHSLGNTYDLMGIIVLEYPRPFILSVPPKTKSREDAWSTSSPRIL